MQAQVSNACHSSSGGRRPHPEILYALNRPLTYYSILKTTGVKSHEEPLSLYQILKIGPTGSYFGKYFGQILAVIFRNPSYLQAEFTSVNQLDKKGSWKSNTMDIDLSKPLRSHNKVEPRL